MRGLAPALAWASLSLSAGIASFASVAGGAQHVYLFPSASEPLREGFVRIINHAAEAGEVRIDPVDDSGRAFDAITLSIDAGETVHFNSGDLEAGNAGKGLSGGTGSGQGDWRLGFSSDLDIEALSYIRTQDGFLTAMHDVAPSQGNVREVAIFNPGSNRNQVSILRLVNPSEATADVAIRGTDDRGMPGAGEVSLSLEADTAREITAAALESGATGLTGALGDGTGKWRLEIESDQPVVAMSLLESPTDHLTNLSTVPGAPEDGIHRVPLFPAAGGESGREGFLRVVNRSASSGEVTIKAYDESDWDYDPVTLTIGVNEVAHFNSNDLEQGNRGKGLSGGVGDGEGDWRLDLTSDLDIRVLSYIRTDDGFLTAMHDVAPSEGNVHRLAVFNPGSNRNQQSLLRLINPGIEAARVTVRGIDGQGAGGVSAVRLSLPAGGTRTVAAYELEEGGAGLEGALGDGAGKWQLTVTADAPVVAMGLLQSPTDHLTNLSTAPERGARGGATHEPQTAEAAFRQSVSPIVQSKCVTCHVEGGDAANTPLVFARGGESHIASNLRVFRDYLAATGDGASRVLEKIQGLLDHGGGAQVAQGTEAYAGFDVFMDRLVAERAIDDGQALLDGVAEIGAPGTPGNLCVYGPGAFPVAAGGLNTGRAPVAAAGRWASGRVVALGHDGYLGRRALKTADTGRLVTNALLWAAGDVRDSPRIGIVDAPELRGWLEATGRQAVETELTQESLAKIDVVALRLWNHSATELEALSAFVRAGGGLIAAATGWGWAQLHPKMDLASAFAGNRLLGAAGIAWGGGYLQRTTPDGFAVDGLPYELLHAAKALDALEARERGETTLAEPEIVQAIESVVSAQRCMPPDDKLFAPRLLSLTEKNEHWPTEQRPVRATDAMARVAATVFVERHRRRPAESVSAHAAAEDFPGAVPTDAPRLSRNLTIDTDVPRWHSTGLYAAPGELVEVTMPEQAAATGGFHIRVGVHSDGIWGRPEWRRMPEVSRRFPVSTPTTLVANAFGGLIYIEVPSNASLGTISVDVEGAVAAPRFVLGQTNATAWRDEIRHAPAPWAEIAGRNMIVTTDAREVRGLDDPEAVAVAWDRVLDLSAELAAWDSPVRSSPERFVVDRQISHGYMHAGYPIMAFLDQAGNLVDAAHLRTEGNWGFFHEVGHNHQNDDWTFEGTVEVTVNLFTLYVYEFLCGIPVAENPRPHASARPEQQMALYDFDNPDFEQWKREPFLALVMYQQLQQAFGWNAYQRVFAEYLTLPEAERPKSDDEKRDQWLVRFSREVEHNLGPFFETWGVPTSQQARDSIADLPTWMPPDFPPPRD